MLIFSICLHILSLNIGRNKGSILKYLTTFQEEIYSDLLVKKENGIFSRGYFDLASIFYTYEMDE